MTHLLIWYGSAARRRAQGRRQAPTMRMTAVEAVNSMDLPDAALTAIMAENFNTVRDGKFWIERERGE